MKVDLTERQADFVLWLIQRHLMSDHDSRERAVGKQIMQKLSGASLKRETATPVARRRAVRRPRSTNG